jgi:hypothetical protein
MKRALFLVMHLAFAGAAFADKYGVDEAMSESSGSLSDIVWGGLLVGGIYWLWNKFF